MPDTFAAPQAPLSDLAQQAIDLAQRWVNESADADVDPSAERLAGVLKDPNGLAFTAVAEIAGPYWGGRALGVQNTGQFVFAAAVGPVFGALIATVGFPLAFTLSAIAPAAAIPVVPKRD